MEKLLHAYILSGAGEATAAKSREMAAAVLCEGTGPRPCGQCRHCRKVLRGDFPGIHPDVTAITRGLSAKGAPRTEIVVDQIRELVRDASVLPNEAAGKVYIFPEADAMNIAAQNALLKLLEEPPSFVTFLLCTESRDALLPTVRSRCAEVRTAPENVGPQGQVRDRAEGYLAARGDRAELLRWCTQNENMDTRTMGVFLDCACACTVDRLTGRAQSEGMSPAQLLSLHALLERCRKMLRVNTGVKQLFGLLAVDAIAERGV